MLTAGDDRLYIPNEWSFAQLCRLAGVAKETVNRLTADTAARVFADTLPGGTKPLQLYTQGDQLRSLHAASYTRLYNTDVLALVQQFAGDFQPPPAGFNGATGLYGGEQDIFCFLIDPTGWIEIDGQEYAPGFFVWNSEVGSRSVGIETFWYQRICANHIVWDATDVTDFSRKHTANVYNALSEISRLINALVAKRDARRDAFTKVVRQAMNIDLGTDPDEVGKVLNQNGVPRRLAKQAIEAAATQGRFTVLALVNALARITRSIVNAGERTDTERQVSKLLTLAA